MTTTERARPVAPRSSSRNSRTSRPRSPTRARTTTSQAACWASIANKVDFPTPEPANKPRRWPVRHVAKRSNARTPRLSRGPSLARRAAGGGSARTDRANPPPRVPRSSMGLPSGSTTRPSQRAEIDKLLACLTWAAASGIDAVAPGPIPLRFANDSARAKPARKPTISATTGELLRGDNCTRSPMASCPDKPPSSAARPETPRTVPEQFALAATSSCSAATFNRSTIVGCRNGASMGRHPRSIPGES